MTMMLAEKIRGSVETGESEMVQWGSVEEELRKRLERTSGYMVRLNFPEDKGKWNSSKMR